MPFGFESNSDVWNAAATGAMLAREKKKGNTNWWSDTMMKRNLMLKDPLGEEKFDLMRQAQELRSWQAQADLKEASARLDIARQAQELRQQDIDRKVESAWMTQDDLEKVSAWEREGAETPPPEVSTAPGLSAINRVLQTRNMSVAAKEGIKTKQSMDEDILSILKLKDNTPEVATAKTVAAKALESTSIADKADFLRSYGHMIPNSGSDSDVGTWIYVDDPDNPGKKIPAWRGSKNTATLYKSPEGEQKRWMERAEFQAKSGREKIILSSDLSLLNKEIQDIKDDLQSWEGTLALKKSDDPSRARFEEKVARGRSELAAFMARREEITSGAVSKPRPSEGTSTETESTDEDGWNKVKSGFKWRKVDK